MWPRPLLQHSDAPTMAALAAHCLRLHCHRASNLSNLQLLRCQRVGSPAACCLQLVQCCCVELGSNILVLRPWQRWQHATSNSSATVLATSATSMFSVVEESEVRWHTVSDLSIVIVLSLEACCVQLICSCRVPTMVVLAARRLRLLHCRAHKPSLI